MSARSKRYTTTPAQKVVVKNKFFIVTIGVDVYRVWAATPGKAFNAAATMYRQANKLDSSVAVVSESIKLDAPVLSF